MPPRGPKRGEPGLQSKRGRRFILILDEPREKLICAHCGFRHDRYHGLLVCAAKMPEARIALISLRTEELDSFTPLEIERFQEIGLADRLANFYPWPFTGRRRRDQCRTKYKPPHVGRDFVPFLGPKFFFDKAG